MKGTKLICKWALLVVVALMSLSVLRAAAKEITSVSSYAAADDVRVKVETDVAPAYQQHLDEVEWMFQVDFPGFSVGVSPNRREGNFPPEVADWVKSYRLEATPLGAQLVLLLGPRATPVETRFTREGNALLVVIPTGTTKKEESYILVPLGLVDPPLRFWEVSAGSAAYRVLPLKPAASAQEEIPEVAAAVKPGEPAKRVVMTGMESFLFPQGIERKPAKHSFIAPTPTPPAATAEPARENPEPAVEAPEAAITETPSQMEEPVEPSWEVHRKVEEVPRRYTYEDFAPRHRVIQPPAEAEAPAPSEDVSAPAPPEAEVVAPEESAPAEAPVALPAPSEPSQQPREAEQPPAEASVPAEPPETSEEVTEEKPAPTIEDLPATTEPLPGTEILAQELPPELKDKPLEVVITKKGSEVEVSEPEPATEQEKEISRAPRPPKPLPPTPQREPRYKWVPEGERPRSNVPPPAPPQSWDVHLPALLPPVPEVTMEYRLLNRERITYEAIDTPLSQAISLMVASTSFNVIVDDVVGDMKVTLSFHDTPLGDALRSITAAKDIMYKLVNNTIIVGKREDVGRRLGGYVSRTFHLNYADAENIRKILTENSLVAETNISVYNGEPESLTIKTGEQELSEGQKGLTGASIKPMKKLGSTARRNVLIITETPERLDAIAQVIAEIDRRPKQVTLETNIVEISEEGLRDLGFHLPESITTNVSEEVPLDSGGSPITVNPIPLGLWFQTLYRDPYTIELSLETVIQNGNARILARPNVPAVDGEQAIFFAGRLIPYISRPATTTGGTYTPPEVEYIPIGVVLSFKPRIDEFNNITMEVNPSVSTLLEFIDLGQGAQAPISQTRQVVTTVRVRDGETFVIGGLLSEEDRVRITKMPLLADIPLFGQLFRRREVTKNRTEIMVFVTPKVYE